MKHEPITRALARHEAFISVCDALHGIKERLEEFLLEVEPDQLAQERARIQRVQERLSCGDGVRALRDAIEVLPLPLSEIVDLAVHLEEQQDLFFSSLPSGFHRLSPREVEQVVRRAFSYSGYEAKLAASSAFAASSPSCGEMFVAAYAQAMLAVAVAMFVALSAKSIIGKAFGAMEGLLASIAFSLALMAAILNLVICIRATPAPVGQGL